MPSYAKNTRVNIIPTLRYADAPAAIEWLCSALGFEKRMVVPGADGTIAHAQLTYGNGMVMVGSARDGEFDDLQKPALELGAVSQSPYIVVDNMHAHYERARAHGAEITMELVSQPYGGEGYACRDPEGNLWSFGSYDPWQEDG